MAAVAGRPIASSGERPSTRSDRRALVLDDAVGPQHGDDIRRVAYQRAEALLASLKVDHQQPLGRRLLLETAVLRREHARCATEREHDEPAQQARRDQRQDEHAKTRRVDAGFDPLCVLVDVVHADRIAVDHPPDGDEQLEIATRQGRVRAGLDVVGGCPAHPRVDVARDAFAGVRAAQLGPDGEPPSAQRRIARIDDPTVARPDADAAQLARTASAARAAHRSPGRARHRGRGSPHRARGRGNRGRSPRRSGPPIPWRFPGGRRRHCSRR